jgi:hypothetical protein
MPEANAKQSKTHDLLGAALGLFALLVLISSAWQVDTTGPDPFYKGPLIFPLIVLSMMVLASIPFWKRLLTPSPEAGWHLDGHGIPWKTLRVLLLLILYLAGLVLAGLEIATAAFLFAALWVVGERSAVRMIAIPLGVSAVLHFFFKFLLSVWFPEPWLFQWI